MRLDRVLKIDPSYLSNSLSTDAPFPSEALKITEKNIQENAFKHRKKKPGLSANWPSNNWALDSCDSCTSRILSGVGVKVAQYSFSGSIPPKFEHKLCHYKQWFGKIATTVVLHKDENLLWSGLQWHRSCHSNEMRPLPILLSALFLGTGNCSSKIVHGSFFLQ